MKIKFKKQTYQLNAVKAVTDCFAGQPFDRGLKYRVDPGKDVDKLGQKLADIEVVGFKNNDLLLDEGALLDNIKRVQMRQNLTPSLKVVRDKIAPVNLDIEMETGTGKTYCYIRTMFEMNKLFGWTKFIIVVPSIAIREGVYQSFDLMAEHFLMDYGKKARVFIYNSKNLSQLENFSSDTGINVMIINVQAFNARGKDARRIRMELDEFQSRKPIDVISANRPILILDEPQKMEGAKTLDSLADFCPLMVLRYSATHKIEHNKIYRLDALDAYQQKLVKKIAVRAISIKNLSGTNAYLYLQNIPISKSAPQALIDFEVKQASQIKRITRKFNKSDDLFSLSNELDQYKGFVIADIDALNNKVSFTNGIEIEVGEAIGDVNEAALRRIQIREAIDAHFAREEKNFKRGIKTLSLFFIDDVSKYRYYDENGPQKGEYARIFEEEYQKRLDNKDLFSDRNYQAYLNGIDVERTHNGYFSIDKKTKHEVNPEVKRKDVESDDVDAYDLILKDKKRLLSFKEPTRFIFSHSALREGWDNPNIFTICALKHSDNTTSRRQEVGRGLRLCVNKNGDRVDDMSVVHDVNVLTVVASESYEQFVKGLQTDITDSLSDRPRKADEYYFTGKILHLEAGDLTITKKMAHQIYRYLVKNDYVDDDDNITPIYHKAVESGTLADFPSELAENREEIIKLVNSIFDPNALNIASNDRKSKTNPLNDNFTKKEFQALWAKINHKAVYTVNFKTEELVEKAINTLNAKLNVTSLKYNIVTGYQRDDASYEDLQKGEAFKVSGNKTEKEKSSGYSRVKYDLIDKLVQATDLTRKTIASILRGINKDVFNQFKLNPEDFITKASRLINEQKATMIVEHLTYDPLSETFATDIFTQNKIDFDFSKAYKAERHIYDYVFTDSNNERKFVEKLDKADEVVVYAKLPNGFLIPTPVGNYNPDWAIAFKEGKVKHIYFVAETKGSMLSLELRSVEKAKIDCAKKFFAKITSNEVKYDVVDSYEKLMDVVQ